MSLACRLNYYYLFWESFIPALADGFSLKSEWQQVSSNLQDSSLFWPIIIMLSFGCSPLVLLFPKPPVPLSLLCWLYRAHQLELVSSTLSCSIVFSVLWQGLDTYLTFRFLSVLSCGQLERLSTLFCMLSLFLDLLLSLLLFFEFFTSALADSLSLKFQW